MTITLVAYSPTSLGNDHNERVEQWNVKYGLNDTCTIMPYGAVRHVYSVKKVKHV